MTPGTLVAERFEIESRTAGGAGRAIRAYDRVTGARVALKILPGRLHEDLFDELSALAALRHPGISAPVAFGRTGPGQGQVFVATEWIEGEDLARRLVRQPLDLTESLALMRGVAEALAALHQRGLVHRGIRPSHLILQGGQSDQVVLLDAGLPMGTMAVRTVTYTEEVAGTLEYTAPEQARGERRVGPEADLFALGCVLHECLVGAPPFTGRSAAVVLARILCEETPSLRQLRPEMPEAVERLLEEMLAKDPRDRPRDGEALLVSLRTVAGTLAQRVMVPGPAPAPPLGLERRLVSILLTSSYTAGGEVFPEASDGFDGTRGPAAGHRDNAVSATNADNAGPDAMKEKLVACRDELQHLLRPYGGRVDCLATGSILATLAPLGCTAVDQAVQAARAALVLQQRLPGSAVALTTGRGVVAGHLALGEVVQQAVDLLLEGEMSAAVAGERPAIWLDALTAGLLEGRYGVRQAAPDLRELEGERTDPDSLRLLLGGPTPYVGREQELCTLEMLYDACSGDEVARAVLVLAPSGTGKSRLRQEWVRRLERRGEAMQVLIGRGDLMRAGTAYGLLAQAVLDLRDTEQSGPGSREAGAAGLGAWFAERVGRHVAPAERVRVVEFLGEMCGIVPSGEPSAFLRAARHDPRLMNTRIAEAWVTFLRAECALKPVLLVLEDLHWSDAATVRLVDVALRELAERPVLVLALARPEVKELFPRLWEGRSLQELHLAGLGRKASERLVHEMLGPRATPEVVARLVGQAGGNALFLEELIRAVAGGMGETLPETVMAMLQARFLRLEPGARRVLRAASVLGETFWRGGVQALLGMEERHEEELDRCLMSLMSGEVIVRQGAGRFAGEIQYAFRHGLLRDAAYGLLREEDRVLGHRAAARYLERMGETDPFVLAEHYRQGDDPERAGWFLARASGQALAASDLDRALRLTEQGAVCRTRGEALGMLRATESWVQIWRWNFVDAYRSALGALPLLPRGSAEWYAAVGAALEMAGILGQEEALEEQCRILDETAPLPGAESAFFEYAMIATAQVSMLGMRDRALGFLGQMQAVHARLGKDHPLAAGLCELALLWHRLLGEGDPWPYLRAAQAGTAAFTAVGDPRHLGPTLGHEGFAWALLGDHEAARGRFRQSLALLEPLQIPLVLGAARAQFAVALVESGEREHLGEAEALATAVMTSSTAPSLWGGLGQVALAGVLRGRGDFGAAEHAARRAVDVLAGVRAARPLALALLGRVLLDQDRAADAQAVAEEGQTLLAALGGVGLGDVKLHLVTAEARHAMGDRERALTALGLVLDQTRRRAAQIDDPAAQERFLLGGEDHARARALAFTLSLDPSLVGHRGPR